MNRRAAVVRPRGVRGSRRRRWGNWLFRGLLRLFAVLVLGWGGGLVWFSLTLPGPAPLALRTDAVVVLTGGAGRLARGLAVMEAGAARRMLVSGVAPTTTRRDLADAADVPVARFAATDLGYGAVDTRSNAEETAAWMARGHYRSLRLVTSSGHMRRARLELARVLPQGISVVVDAVPHERGAPGIPWEYTKFLWRRLALLGGAS